MSEPTDPPTEAREPSEEAREAADMGEKPDLGRERDALVEALTGTGMGSDTRAGSLRGGSASGSENDPDQTVINNALADEGRNSARTAPPALVSPPAVKNTGVEPGEGSNSSSADAATG